MDKWEKCWLQQEPIHGTAIEPTIYMPFLDEIPFSYLRDSSKKLFIPTTSEVKKGLAIIDEEDNDMQALLEFYPKIPYILAQGIKKNGNIINLLVSDLNSDFKVYSFPSDDILTVDRSIGQMRNYNTKDSYIINPPHGFCTLTEGKMYNFVESVLWKD